MKYKEIIKAKYDLLQKDTDDMKKSFENCKSKNLQEFIKQNEKMLNIMRAYLSGEEIEFFDTITHTWIAICLPSFNEKYKYRIAKNH